MLKIRGDEKRKYNKMTKEPVSNFDYSQNTFTSTTYKKSKDKILKINNVESQK